MGKYKDKKGTSRVGDFLRSIGKYNILEKVAGAASSLLTGDIHGALQSILKNSNELTSEEREYALKLLESDRKENEEITNRWMSDMSSDSFLSKNIRPMVLIFLCFSLFVFIILDSSIKSFVINEDWISLLKGLLMLVFFAYFGGRSYEKTKRK